MKINAPRMAYLSLVTIYLLVPVIHDVMPGYPDLKTNDWVALLGIYALGCIAALPLFFQLLKSKGAESKLVKFFYARWLLCFLIQMLNVIFFWHNSIALYISLPFVIVLSAFIMSFDKNSKAQGASIYQDDESGTLYLVNAGIARKLSSAEVQVFKSKVGNIDIPIFNVSDFSLATGVNNSTQEVLINPSSGLPMINGLGSIDVGGNTWGSDNLHSGISVNPTSGLPMNGINSGIDIDGNSWGTTSSGIAGVSSSFDSDRGY